MWTSTEKTSHSKTACLEEGPKFQKHWLHAHGWVFSTPKDPINEKNLCGCGVWIKNLLTPTTQSVNLFEGNVGNLYGLSRVSTHFCGKRQNGKFSYEAINQLHSSFAPKLVHHFCEMHPIRCCSLISISRIPVVQTTQQLIFFPEKNLELRWKYVS